jgi:hypothetical protein
VICAIELSIQGV